jgi:hypothetical protein
MTQNQFISLCNQYSIHPSIALENDELVQALQDRDDDLVKEILENQF